MKTINVYLSLLMLALLGPLAAYTQHSGTPGLKANIMKVIDTSKARIGVRVLGIDFEDGLSINGAGHFPMQSVFKFPLALAILHQVDQGKLSLSQKIHIRKESIYKNTWSPIAKKFPDQDIDMPLSELLTYTVSQSDNNGCDILFGLAGGTKAVNDYIHSLGVKGIAIGATEAQMRKAWAVQYTNWCAPEAMAQLLRQLYLGKILKPDSSDFLLKIMTESVNNNRIKGQLPATAQVAHKTGTSDTNKQGIKAATNDVGILTLPDGRHIALVVYVSDFPGDTERGEHIIAAIARLVWDHYATP